jgi:hypothetical protein
MAQPGDWLVGIVCPRCQYIIGCCVSGTLSDRAALDSVSTGAIHAPCELCEEEGLDAFVAGIVRADRTVRHA